MSILRFSLFRFSIEVQQAILAECLTPDRFERVGLLFGEGCRIAAARPLRNLERRPGRFCVDMHEVQDATRDMAQFGLTILGRFHTHPGGPNTPSLADQASLPEGWFDLIAHVQFASPRARLVNIAAYDHLARALPIDWGTGQALPTRVSV